MSGYRFTIKIYVGEELPHLLLHAGRPEQGAQGPPPPQGRLPLQVPHRGQ